MRRKFIVFESTIKISHLNSFVVPFVPCVGFRSIWGDFGEFQFQRLLPIQTVTISLFFAFSGKQRARSALRTTGGAPLVVRDSRLPLLA